MTLGQALAKADAMRDPYTEYYAWLYQTGNGRPALAGLWIFSQERCQYAAIGIYDDSENALVDSVEWLLTSSDCVWRDMQRMSWEARDSNKWQVSKAEDIVPIIKGKKT